MSDIIHLLPDNIANQIAAGEVIQRPASAVKELLENAVDAGADEIKLFVNDAGKSLVQVIDNGKGMSETDARMSFERHATSKISNISDLFHIKTMGFRGEALASIAGVSQVELRTKKASDQTGTYIEIENSAVKVQQQIAMANGTSLAMKNLFFNVPARRNFLKSNASELRHIVEEFIRVAMSFPGIFFSLNSNGQQVFYLEKGTLKHRIVQILGNNYTSKLVSVQENTDYMNVYGFVGKPETAKKTRGDQYFFVNNRFIRSAYLNHAVISAFNEMISKDSFPMYTLFIDLDPARLDVNVHPTKQEIKFEDEKIVYAFVQSAIKHALAQFSVSPTLDFSLDSSIQNSTAVTQPFTTEKRDIASTSSLYEVFTQKNQAHFIDSKSTLRSWPDMPSDSNKMDQHFPTTQLNTQQIQLVDHGLKNGNIFFENAQQFHNCYIIVQNELGFIVIHQQNAHERVLYEKFLNAVQGKPIAIQRSLFPNSIELTPSDAITMNELLSDLHTLGYAVEPFGNNTFIIQGIPADVSEGNEKVTLETMLNQYSHFSNDLKFSKREKLIRSMAWQQSVKAGNNLSQKEIKNLIDDLFNCEQSNITPNGKPVYLEFKKNELDKMFGR